MLTIKESIQRIQQGGVVAIPTETVYGLAADASKPLAVKRIFTIKGRPADHPLIVHIGTVAQVYDWADEIPGLFWPLAEKFWPGPLTFILKKKTQVNTLITGGLDTIAL
jgi:L-threonylcarbamoyladenylate synthase